MIRFKLKQNDAKKDLKRRIAKTKTTEKLMRKIAGDLEHSTEENFKQQGRQPRWERLKSKTLISRKRRGKTGKILQVSGQLKSSITTRYDKLRAVIGTNLKYARIHQFGGMAGKNKSARIPARPYLKLSRREERNIQSRIRKYFA